MTVETLIKLSLQYLEVDSDMNTSEITDIDDIKASDTFTEYLNNVETAIYSGISRYAASLVLPLQEIKLDNKVTILEFNNPTVKNGDNNTIRTINTKEKIFKRIKEVYALDENSNVKHNIKYTLIGSKLIITDFKSDYNYYVVYHPNVLYFDNYRDNSQTKYDVELSYMKLTDPTLGAIYVNIPDEMAINIKYMVYSELKQEDYTAIANANRNYFEAYLDAEINNAQTQNYQEEINGIDYGDRYGKSEDGNTANNYLYDYLSGGE